jgi:hypothetical protein
MGKAPLRRFPVALLIVVKADRIDSRKVSSFRVLSSLLVLAVEAVSNILIP